MNSSRVSDFLGTSIRSKIKSLGKLREKSQANKLKPRMENENLFFSFSFFFSDLFLGFNIRIQDHIFKIQEKEEQKMKIPKRISPVNSSQKEEFENRKKNSGIEELINRELDFI